MWRAENTSMMNRQSTFERVVVAIVDRPGLIFFMMPIFWLVTTSFKFGREAFAIPPKWIFFDFTLRNFQEVLATTKIGQYMINSIIISTGATTLSLVLGVPAGYAIARLALASSAVPPISFCCC